MDMYELINTAIDDIDYYYDASFRVQPDKALTLLLPLIEKMASIAYSLSNRQGEKLKEYLGLMLNAMEQKDYVIVRDYLYYEIRGLFLGIVKAAKSQ